MVVAFYFMVGLPFSFADQQTQTSEFSFQLQDKLESSGHWEFLTSPVFAETYSPKGEVSIESDFFSSFALFFWYNQEVKTQLTTQATVWVAFTIKELIFPFAYFW